MQSSTDKFKPPFEFNKLKLPEFNKLDIEEKGSNIQISSWSPTKSKLQHSNFLQQSQSSNIQISSNKFKAPTTFKSPPTNSSSSNIHKLHPTHSNLLRQFKTPSDSQSQISVRQFKAPSTNWNLHPTNSSNLHPSDKVNNKQISTIQNQISSNKFKFLSDKLKSASYQQTQISSDKFESPSTICF